MLYKFGPVDLRCYQGTHEEDSKWTTFELAFVTNREGGLARRETGVRLGFRSDHLTEATGRENPADTFTDPVSGQIFTGKIVSAPTGVYAITAKEIYTAWLLDEARQNGLTDAANAFVLSGNS